MRVPAGQKRVLDALGHEFCPMLEVDIARAVYPNHSAWETMGVSGSWAWSGLVSKIVNMLGALETLGLVWQVGTKRWTRSNKFNVKALQDYWDWIEVCCDALSDDEELRAEAIDAICWYVVRGSWDRHNSRDLLNPDIVMLCVQTTLNNVDWTRGATWAEVSSGLNIVARGIYRIAHPETMTRENALELVRLLRENSAAWRTGTKVYDTFAELIAHIDKKVLRTPLVTASTTGSMVWSLPRGGSNETP